MSVLSSGLWCDLCRKPILSGEYWHVGIAGMKGHCCETCYELHNPIMKYVEISKEKHTPDQTILTPANGEEK